jgi:hypothetical protein
LSGVTQFTGPLAVLYTKWNPLLPEVSVKVSFKITNSPEIKGIMEVNAAIPKRNNFVDFIDYIDYME